MKTSYKTLIYVSSSIVAIGAAVGLVQAQDKVDREPFYSNDVRLQRATKSPHVTTSATPAAYEAESAPAPSEAPAAQPTRARSEPVAAAEPARTSSSSRAATPVVARSNVPPIDAKAGECYAQVLVEAKMVPVSERVKVREESYELVEIPAQFEEVEEQVIVKAGFEMQEVVPATYKTVEERVEKNPAYTRRVPVAPIYETRTESVMVKPERVYWKQGKNPVTELENPMSEIMCLVRDPAEYKTVERRVLVKPASYREEKIPAEYETYTRTVVDQPAQVRTVKVPPVFETRLVRKMTEPARTERREIPAQFEEVQRMVAQDESRIEWRRVLCETNATPEVITHLQSQLNERGYAVEIDGELGPQTQTALRDFQRDNNLPLAGISYASLDALGVRY